MWCSYFRLLAFGCLFIGGAHSFGQTNLDSLNRALSNAKADSTKIEVLIELSSYYCELLPDSANYYLDLAQQLAVGDRLQRFRPKVLRFRAIVMVVNGDYEKALATLRAAQKLCEPAPTDFLKSEIAGIYNLMGVISDYQSIYDSALFYYFKSLEIYQALNRTSSVLMRYNNIAVAYERLGNFPLALKYLFDALAKSTDDAGSAKFMLNIGRVYIQMEEPEKAKVYLLMALNRFNSIGIHDTSESYVCVHLGQVYSSEGKPDSALYYFKRALAINEKASHKNGIAEDHYYIGVHYKNMHQWNLVVTEAQKAASLFQEADTKSGVAESKHLLALAYYHQNNYDNALTHATEALAIANSIQAKQTQKLCYEIISKIYAAKKQFEKAFLAAQALSALNDSINNSEKIKQVANMEAIFETNKKEKELALVRAEKVATDAKLSEQKNRTLFLGFAIGFLCLLLLAGAYFYYSLKKKRQLLASKNEELRQLNQTKDRFFAIVGHDLRGPITSFSGLNELINWYIEKKEFDRLKTIGSKVTQSVKQLDTLLNNLLSWAMSQTNAVPYRPEPLQLSQLTAECVSFFQHAVEGKQLELRDLTKDDLFIYADKNALATVIRNLISNAIKFTPAVGQVKIAAESKGAFVWISVSDTGVGISQEKQKTLFKLSEDKSTRGTSGEKGTGLGLMLCQECVTLNKGSLEVLSEVNKGTTFIFSVPSFQPAEITTLSQEVLHG